MNQATSTMKGMTKMETCTLEPTATPIAMSILSLYAMTTAVAAHVGHTSRTPITKHQQHTRAQLELRGSATRRRPIASAKEKEKQERLRV